MILSIESSCDDSSIALTDINTNNLIFHKKITQITHNKYGGVVPEIAAREHAQALPLLLEEIALYLPKVKAIGVTNLPGLSLTLLEGIMMAKSLSISLDLPLIGVNHLYGHIYSLFIESKVILPQLVLLASGGHTALFEVFSFEDIKYLGGSIDDSIGESFDKVSKMLGLGYPGGAIIEEYAHNGDENTYAFPNALKHKKQLAFSYSGLKNAVRLEIEKSKQSNTLKQDTPNICASFQKMATKHLVDKTNIALLKSKIPNFAIVGGVSANNYIRNKFQSVCDNNRKKLFLPKMEFCSDNAAMIGRIAVEMYKNGVFTKCDDLHASSRFL